MIKRSNFSFLLIVVLLTFSSDVIAQSLVPGEVMREIYQEVKTPFKYGLVLTSEDSAKMVDSPSIFRHKGSWYMSYIVFDGKGYETWLAKSDDLLNWGTLGRILSFADGTWD